MTAQEINEAVARKLGIELTPCPIMDSCSCCGPQNYCTDIKAAWEIVEVLPGFQIMYIGIFDGPSWRCITRHNLSGEFISYQYDADTAPMAICLAFLKLQ